MPLIFYSASTYHAEPSPNCNFFIIFIKVVIRSASVQVPSAIIRAVTVDYAQKILNESFRIGSAWAVTTD
jgi:hypothetical protein